MLMRLDRHQGIALMLLGMRTGLRRAAMALTLAIVGCGSSTAETGPGTGGTEATQDCITDASTFFVRPFDVDEGQYPFESCAYETNVGLLHYLDVGPKDAEHTVVMVHGNPTWSFLYRNIIPELVADGDRVVVPDHVGMGMSDVPSTSAFDYRPRSHANHLQDLVAALDLQNITLVVQDWGGPIGLDLATKEPERIGRILIMNTWAWSVDVDDPGYAHQMVRWYEQVQLAQTVPDLFCRAFLPGQAAENAIQADPSEGSIHDAVLSAYISPHIVPATGDYRHAEPCAPMQIFAESIFDDNAFQAEIEGRLPTLRGTPYGLLFGLSDILFGAQRCDVSGDIECPGASTCVCDAELLPDRVDADCATAPREYFVCKDEETGMALEPFADRFVELLGEDGLVAREAEPTSDHMIQEAVPDRVVAAIRALIENGP